MGAVVDSPVSAALPTTAYDHSITKVTVSALRKQHYKQNSLHLLGLTRARRGLSARRARFGGELGLQLVDELPGGATAAPGVPAIPEKGSLF